MFWLHQVISTLGYKYSEVMLIFGGLSLEPYCTSRTTEWLLQNSFKQFIFTTSLPPCIAAGAYASIRHLKFSDEERKLMMDNVKKLKYQLKRNNIPFLDNNSHIIPVLIGDPKLCKKASQILLDDFRIYVQPINHPTVPRGTERLRITCSPNHSQKMIKEGFPCES